MHKTAILAAAPLLLASSAALAGWEAAEPNLGTIVMGIDMKDAQNGLAVGGNNGSGPVIWRTLDGGDTWRVANTDMLTMSYLDISMSDGDFGVTGGMGAFWMWGGSTRTDDGGRTWQKSGGPQFVAVYQDVEAIDDTHAALVGSWGSVRQYYDGVNYTSDGGRTWTGGDWGIDDYPRYVSFANPNVGYVSGGHWPSDSARSMSPWEGRAISQHMRLPMTFDDPVAKAESTGYRGVVAKTTDSGRTWELILDMDGLYFNGIHFIDEMNGWVVGEGEDTAKILHTTDGGRTWVEQWSGTATLMQVRMVNSRVGWAAGGDLSSRRPTTLILHTTDGGETWLPDAVGVDFIMFNLDAVDESHAFGVGYNLASGNCGVLRYEAQ